MMNAVQGASWMSHCPPETLITKLLLPGTHDTMTASCPERYYHTQIMSLEEQLMAGVRFLDLRLRREMKAAHREWISDIDADQIFSLCAEFLSCYPREMLLVRIQNANEKKDDYEAYGAALKEKIESWEELFYHWEDGAPAWMSLEACAGKIVAIECSPPVMAFGRYHGCKWAENWHENEAISLQDLWDGPTITEKQAAIRMQMDTACCLPETVLSLSHISATNGEPGFPDAFADALNPYSLTLLDEYPKTRGVLIYDFITPEICREVFAKNYMEG